MTKCILGGCGQDIPLRDAADIRLVLPNDLKRAVADSTSSQWQKCQECRMFTRQSLDGDCMTCKRTTSAVRAHRNSCESELLGVLAAEAMAANTNERVALPTCMYRSSRTVCPLEAERGAKFCKNHQCMIQGCGRSKRAQKYLCQQHEIAQNTRASAGSIPEDDLPHTHQAPQAHHTHHAHQTHATGDRTHSHGNDQHMMPDSPRAGQPKDNQHGYVHHSAAIETLLRNASLSPEPRAGSTHRGAASHTQPQPTYTSNSNSDSRKRSSRPSVTFNDNELRTSTKQFSADNLLRDGKYGPIYWARGFEALGGCAVTVKVLKKTTHVQEKTLKFVHPNIFKVYGTGLVKYSNESRLCIVSEYMEGGSLARALNPDAAAGGTGSYKRHPGRGKQGITWMQRLKAIEDVLKALSFLHRHMDHVHGNFDSTNILLDEHFNEAVLYGLAFEQVNPDTHRHAQPMQATHTTGEKPDDVFAVGVVLLEILTGKPACSANGASIVDELADSLKRFGSS